MSLALSESCGLLGMWASSPCYELAAKVDGWRQVSYPQTLLEDEERVAVGDEHAVPGVVEISAAAHSHGVLGVTCRSLRKRGELAVARAHVKGPMSVIEVVEIDGAATIRGKPVNIRACLGGWWPIRVCARSCSRGRI